MAYKGQFIDRTPIICPAGKVADRTKLSDCLKFYPLVDKIDTIKHELKVPEKEPFPLKPQRCVNTRNQGIYTESRPMIRPPVRTRYQNVINDLKETPYRCYWDKQLARSRDPMGGLPAGMDPENTLFGKHYIRQYGMKELINPPKSVLEVLYDSQEGHDLYRKSHNDYNPSERVNRGYLEPAYDPNKIYGYRSIYDKRGIWVKCACTWHISSPVSTASYIQADMVDKSKPKLGKCLTPINNINSVPKGHMFGNPCKREMCGMEDLLKDPDFEPCLFKRDFMDWIKHLSELRSYIKRRRGLYIDLKEIYDSILFYDKDKIGWIPVDDLYEICKCKNLNFNHDKMSSLATLIGIMRDGYMAYDEFLQLIDVNKPTPNIIKINDIPEKNMYYVTTNMAAKCDYLTMDNRFMPRAGTPSMRNDIPRPSVPAGGCRADIESLGDETTARAVVNPSIYTNFGLSHRDFFLPRKPEFVKTLFERLGYQFPEGTFEKIWKIGIELDQTGLVCVDTFKKILKQSICPPEFIVEEK